MGRVQSRPTLIVVQRVPKPWVALTKKELPVAVAVFRFVDSNELSGVKDASHIYSVKHSMRELNSQLNQNRTKPGVIAWLAASVALLCLPVTLAFGDCPADLDGSGEVGGSDIGLLLAQWGPGSGSADLNEDGLVSGADLGAMLGAWGWCPCEESLEFDPIHDGSEPLEPAIVEHIFIKPRIHSNRSCC